jgi:hypothetical protein
MRDAMTRRSSRWLAGGLLLAGLSLFLAAGALSVTRGRNDFLLALSSGLVLTIPFIVTGSIVIARLPYHPVGWLLWLVGFSQALVAFSDAWSGYHDGGLPLARAFEIVAGIAWIPGLGVAISLLPLLFPAGRPLTSRWRWAGWMAVIGIMLMAIANFVCAWLQQLTPSDAPASNAPVVWQMVFLAGGLLMLAGAGVSVVSVAVRFRRAQGVERQQMKWFTFAIVVVLLIVMSAVTPLSLDGRWFDAELSVGFLVLAVAIAIAMLRYRLYEIDRLINRALVYGSVTALLLGTYVVLVVTLQRALDPLTSGSDLAVAGSTLAVAALFQPVRSRVQQAVDRRFYRRKYDAARTLEKFAGRLRDEIDLDALAGELRTVIDDTMQPAQVSLWLRTPNGAERR